MTGKSIFLVLCLILFMQLSYAQSAIADRVISIDSACCTVDDILDELALKGGFTFSYGHEVPRNKRIVLGSRKQSIRQYLDELFEGKISCVEHENKIILIPKPSEPSFYNISGKIIDKTTGESIPGVTIFIPGSDPLIGTTSDTEGNFFIKVPSDFGFITLSCIGYQKFSLETEKNKNIGVELSPENRELVEIKVVYYKPMKEEHINAAQSTIEANFISTGPEQSIESVLQGSTAGIHVVHNSGMPGASIQVRVRGGNSLLNNDPVYYLDGISIQSALINSVSSNDIEKIEVIKDASGTAKYGARGANGVVLLHSKIPSKNSFSANLNVSFGRMIVGSHGPELLSSEEFLAYADTFGLTNLLEEYNVDSLIEADWKEHVFHPANYQNYHFSVARGNENSRYYLSTAYFNKEAIIKNLSMKRYSFKLNAHHNVSSTFSLGHDLSMANLKLDGLNEGSFLNDMDNPILGAIRKIPFPEPASIGDDGLNPHNPEEVPIIEDEYYKLSNNLRNNYSLIGHVFSDVKLFENFNYRTRLSAELLFQDNVAFSKPLSGEEYIDGNRYNILDMGFNWIQDFNYYFKPSDDHMFDFYVGYEGGQSATTWIPQNQTRYNTTMDSTVASREKWNNDYETRFMHFIYKASLLYKLFDRYTLEFDIVRDKVRYNWFREPKELKEFYPAGKFSWVFSRERFFPVDFINYGKLYFGWGKAGNSPRVNYSYITRVMREFEYVYAMSESIYRDISPFYRRTNEYFYWETLSSKNLGLDIGMLSNQLFFSFNYYHTQTSGGETFPHDTPGDIYRQITTMNGFGIHSPQTADIAIQGIEGEMSIKTSGRNWTWNCNINLSHSKSKILKTDEPEHHFNNYDVISFNKAGQSPGSFYGYKIEKLFKEEDVDPVLNVINQQFTTNEYGGKIYPEPGDYKFVDINKDNKIDENDKTIIGNPFPDFTFGMFQSFQYGNVDFSFFLQGIYGNEVFNLTKFWTYNPFVFSNWTEDIKKSYRPGYTTTNLHRVDIKNINKNLRISDFYIEDGSYLRLKNIQLGYSFNTQFINKTALKKIRIYLSVQNLLTLTNYSGLDPEVGGWGIDCGIYPQPRTYIAGLNIGF